MGKLEKSFYWLCFVLAIYITIGFKIVPLVLKDQLIKNLDENLTQKTSIENVEFNPFTLSAKIHGFRLFDENNNSDISFTLLSIDFALMRSIEKRHISLQNITLDGSNINVIQDKDGILNLTKLVKPSEEKEEKKEDQSSSDIKFLISKIDLTNANISYTTNVKEQPYTLNLKDINYTIYDLGTYKDALSSNNLKFRINEHTDVAIGGAFKLNPFKMYGKVYIDDLRIKELLDFKKELFNFNINEDANINLVLNYNVDTTKELELKLNSDLLEVNNIDLKQNDKTITSLKKLDIKKFDFDLQSQNILLNDILIDSLNASMISDKNGINFAKLINESKNDEKAETTDVITKEEASKPWIVNLSNINANTNFTFDDKNNNTQINAKATSLSLKNLKIINSDINLDSLQIVNSNLSYLDNKNKFDLKTKNTKINLDNMSLQNNILDINKLSLNKDSLSFNDKKSNLNLNTKNIDLILNNLKIENSKTTLESVNLKIPNIIFEDNKSNINVKTKELGINVNKIAVIDSKTTVNSVNLKIPNVTFDDKKSNINLNTQDLGLIVNNIDVAGSKTTVNSVNLKIPNTIFDDIKSRLNVKVSNTNLDVNNFVLNNSDISIKDIKLAKTGIVLADKTNHLNLNANNLNLNIYKLSNTKAGLKVEKTDLINPNISVVLAKSTNVKNDDKKTKASDTPNKNSQNQTKLNIGPVNINNAIFTFEDKNLPIPFVTKVTKLNGKISEIKNAKSSTTNLSVDGIVDKYGVAKITGIVDPNNIKILTDINMKFNNIAMQNFTPYTGKFIGRELKSGKLDLDLKYNIEKSNLEAKNNITITKLELGEKVESPDAVSLPLDIAITLLQNSKGIIDIKLPVSGNVDDPQFAIGSIVWNAFINLMTKAVTAPFSLLGSLFNFSEDEINNVKFDLAEDKITPIQTETLDKISQILTAKPELAIKISASYDKTKEEYALKEKKYLTKNPEDKNLKKEELQKLVLKEKATQKELETIAKNRVSNIKNYLVKEKAISSKQIIITNDIENSNSSITLKIDKIK